mmetsp:Transcript_21422/g.50366  ORF Transcript_21422/g.50366 Transcript_21422/m.50366 type:complete len:214 (+) Transcript_21422:550-1191(+)
MVRRRMALEGSRGGGIWANGRGSTGGLSSSRLGTGICSDISRWSFSMFLSKLASSLCLVERPPLCFSIRFSVSRSSNLRRFSSRSRARRLSARSRRRSAYLFESNETCSRASSTDMRRAANSARSFCWLLCSWVTLASLWASSTFSSPSLFTFFSQVASSPLRRLSWSARSSFLAFRSCKCLLKFACSRSIVLSLAVSSATNDPISRNATLPS